MTYSARGITFKDDENNKVNSLDWAEQKLSSWRNGYL